MKSATFLATLFLTILGAQAESLSVTFGTSSSLSSHYGKLDLTGNTTQGRDAAAPLITIGGLDLDGLGTNDDRIEIQFSVESSQGEAERLAAGYRFDQGATLTLGVQSAQIILGTEEKKEVNGKIISAEGHNKGASFTSEMKDGTLVLKSTAARNNRIGSVSAKFEIPEDFSKMVVSAKSSATTEAKPEARKSKVTKPAKAVAPPVLNTDSLKLPRLFCDDMILQQQTKNTFWGWANAGEEISVKASWGARSSAKAGPGGKWKLFLETPKHGTGHSLTIRGKTDTIEIRNVAIGEVWLCAGQSNMGWSMGNSFDADLEADVDLPDFRIFRSAREHWHEPLGIQRDRLSQWKPCGPDSAAQTSAVSYYFGKKLHEELGIPVGIIQQSFAGTPIEGWMPWEIQKDDPRAIAHKADYDKSAERQAGAGDTREAALAAWQEQLDEYNALIDAGDTMKNSVKALAPPIITKPANLGHQYPGHEFNAMIHPVRPYGIRGAIWYQGERNSKNVPQAVHYRKQLAMLIRYYRESWHELSGGNVAADFPFQFTQLPSWTPPQSEPAEGLAAPWAVNRESMRLVTQDVPNTAMAVSIDTGDAVQLHPKNKKPIGIRHAYLALRQTYGKDFVDYGPRFQKQTIDGHRIVLEFDSIGGGMVAAKPGEKLDAFAIAGADQKWHWADVEIQGSTVVVSSEEVSEPVAVRYAWAMNPSQRNLLYNREGIPASPFRTDDWPLFDPDAELVAVEKPAKLEEKVSVDWERPEMTQ